MGRRIVFLSFFIFFIFFLSEIAAMHEKDFEAAVAFSPLLRSKNLFATLEVGRWKIRLVRRNHSTQKAFEEVVDEIWTTGMNIARGSRSGSGYSFLARLVSPTASLEKCKSMATSSKSAKSITRNLKTRGNVLKHMLLCLTYSITRGEIRAISLSLSFLLKIS